MGLEPIETIRLYLGPADGQVYTVPPRRTYFQYSAADGKPATYARTAFTDNQGRQVFAFQGAALASIRGEVRHADIHSLFPENRIMLYIAMDPASLDRRSAELLANRRVRLIVEEEPAEVLVIDNTSLDGGGFERLDPPSEPTGSWREREPLL